MGIRTGRVDALTFAFGSGVAGMAGVALSQIDNVSPNLGTGYIIDSFMVVVFGGVGSLAGTLVGAMTLGVVNKVLEPYAGAVLAKVAVLVAIMLFIQRRPRWPVRAPRPGGRGVSATVASPAPGALALPGAEPPALGAGRRGAAARVAAGPEPAAGGQRACTSRTSSCPVTGKWITYAFLALAIDLAWGYAGILSLGHGAFFALGGYAIGMHLMRPDRPARRVRPPRAAGLHGVPRLPRAALVLARLRPLPLRAADGPRRARLLAGLVGFLAFRSRITGVYFSIITQALTYALMLAFFRNDMGFGGNNGFTDFKELLGMPLNTPDARAALFYASLPPCSAPTGSARAWSGRSSGRVLVAVRDAESRVRFLGYDTTRIKLFVFVLSAVLAGLAGGSTCRRSASSTPASSAPATPSRRWSGSRWAAAAPWRARARRLLGQRAQDLADLRGAGPLAVRAGRPLRRRHPVPAARPRRPAAEARTLSAAGPLPRRRFRRLRRLPALNNLSRRCRARASCAPVIGPNGAWQDHDDGRHHRQRPAPTAGRVRFPTTTSQRTGRGRIATLGIAASSRTRPCSTRSPCSRTWTGR
jgi:urea transport system permease protein